MSRPAVYLVGLGCGIVLVGLTLYVVWRHPARDGSAPASRTRRVGSWLLVALRDRDLAAAVHGLGDPVLHRRHPAAAADPAAQRCISRWRTCCGRQGSAAAEAVPSLAAVTLERGLRAAAADRRRLPDRLAARPRRRRDDDAGHHGDAAAARRDQRGRDPAGRRLRLASARAPGSTAASPRRASRRRRRRRGAAPGAAAHAAADPAERAARGPGGDGGADGALGARRRRSAR